MGSQLDRPFHFFFSPLPIEDHIGSIVRKFALDCLDVAHVRNVAHVSIIEDLPLPFIGPGDSIVVPVVYVSASMDDNSLQVIGIFILIIFAFFLAWRSHVSFVEGDGRIDLYRV